MWTCSVLTLLTLTALPESPQLTPDPSATPITHDAPLLAHLGQPRYRPYRLNPAIDISVILATTAIWVFPEFMLKEMVITAGRCPCDPAQLNPFDRRWAGVSVPGTHDLSVALTAVLLAGPVVFDAFDIWRSGADWVELIEDTVVIGESLLVGGALNDIAKIAFQRPRPQAYGIDPWSASLNAPDTYMSFYSGIAAEVFTAVTAGAVTYAYRHPKSISRWVYLGVAYLAAGAFSATRVFFGRHFPTDVIAGVAVGSLVGLVVPWLHRRTLPVALTASVAPNAAHVGFTFTLP